MTVAAGVLPGEGEAGVGLVGGAEARDIDPLGLERGSQPAAEGVVADHAAEGGRHAEPRQGDGDIGWCPAGTSAEGFRVLKTRCLAGHDQVHQRLTEGEDGPCGAGIGARVERHGGKLLSGSAEPTRHRT